MKTCSKCKIEKELTEFDIKNGKSISRCKDCRRETVNNHYAKNIQQYLDRNKRTIERNKQLLLEAKSRPCSECGGSFLPNLMDLHHRDPKEKEGEITKMANNTSTKKFKKELDKCDPLCANCHRMVTFYSELTANYR